MRESVWALIILGIFLHRSMDFYCAYCKWAQVHRGYRDKPSAPLPRYVSFVVEGFPKIAMASITLTMLFTIFMIPYVSTTQPSLSATLPALLFSLLISTLGFWADWERERLAQL
jgi:hypothetical protein